MDTLWRLFSYYMPTIRDDGRDYELPIYGSTSNSSRPRARGQRHDRPRSVPHVRDIQARWKKEDEAEMEDLQAITRTARPQPVLEKAEVEESRKRRRSVVETDDPSPAKPPPSPAETDKANETEKTVASRVATSLSPLEASSKRQQHSGSHVQRHERRKSGKLRDDGTSRSGEFQPSSSSARIVTLQRELQQLQADLSSTKFELEHQRSVNIHLLAQKSRVESELAQVTGTRNAQAAELLALRAALADRALAERPPDMRDEELATLKSFLTKTDNYSGAQILQFVHDLNTEIVQLAAAVSEEFPLSRREPSSWTPAQEDLIRSALGEGMLGMLRDSEHDEDPCLVQLAVQAWEVRCCQDILDAFCAGVAPEVDRFLRNLFEEMQAAEPQATTSRWRALTHLHARNMVARLDSVSPEAPPPSSASAASSCISPIALLRPQAAYPTPESSNNNTPASQIFALPSMSLALAAPAAPVARTNLDGLRAILALAGCTDERGTSPGPLAERFGDAVTRIGEAAEALARAVREGVSSAWFAVRVTPPAHSFDAADMENTYAGYGDETADVLCTVGLGLEVVKRVEPTPDRDQNAALQRTLLLKPKVILASVQELL